LDEIRIVDDLSRRPVCRGREPVAVFPAQTMNDRHPLQYIAGSLAGSAFIAVTQILTGVKLDLPLYVALVAFAINIPFQILSHLMRIPTSSEEARRLEATSQPLSWPQRPWSAIYFLRPPSLSDSSRCFGTSLGGSEFYSLSQLS